MLCNAISVDSLSEEQAAELMNSLRQQMMRLPDQDQLKTCSVESRILMDHQTLIPAHNLSPKEFHYDRVQRWVDFLSKHPEIKDNRIWTRFDLALADVIFTKTITPGKTVFFRKQYFAFIREQIRRLTGSQRSLMLRYSSPALKRALNRAV